MPKRSRTGSFDESSNSDSSYDSVQKKPKKRRRLERWMVGLDENKIEEYEYEINKLRKESEDQIISELDIVKLTIPFEEKVKLMEQLNILSTLHLYSREWYDQKNRLYESLISWNLEQCDMDIINSFKEKQNYNVGLRERILKSSHSATIKSVLYDKYTKIQNYPSFSEEFLKEKKWLETVLSLPTKTIPIFNEIKYSGNN